MEIIIKGEQARINIDVLNRSYPDSDDYADGNWLSSNIRISLPGISTDFPLSLRAEEFAAFKNELVQMNATLSGVAKFETMESGIYLEAQCQKTGPISWKVKIWYPEGYGAKLDFSFENDQSYLPNLISQLKAVTKAFPIKGKP